MIVFLSILGGNSAIRLKSHQYEKGLVGWRHDLAPFARWADAMPFKNSATCLSRQDGADSPDGGRTCRLRGPRSAGSLQCPGPAAGHAGLSDRAAGYDSDLRLAEPGVFGDRAGSPGRADFDP